MLGQMRADLGFGAGTLPVWLRDNPFLQKAGRAETRRLGLPLRLALTIVLLGGLLLGGLALQAHSRTGSGLAFVLGAIFHVSLPAVLFVAVSFAHVLLVSNARTASAISVAEEARRATLPDLLMTPLRRAEMLLAMGVGPARSAGLLALAGLPIYALLAEFGGVTAWEVVCLYVLLGLLCFQPPPYAIPALSGLGQTPDAAPGQFAAAAPRRNRRAGYFGAGFSLVLSFLFLGQFLGAVGGGWLAHLFSALHLTLFSGFSFLLFLSWPYYAVQVLSGTLPFFHTTLSPLWYVLPLTLLTWAGSALTSGSVLSAGSAADLRGLPLATRAVTLTRTTARLIGFCALAVVWRAWVESGDTASLAGQFASGPGEDAAGLLVLLGAVSLPNVCGRALAVDPRFRPGFPFRSPFLVLRRALKRALRPLWVATGAFLLVCLCGDLSPFVSPVSTTAGEIAAAGLSTVFWAVGVRRALPNAGKWASALLLYVLPFAALSVPGGSLGAALSPVPAWVRLFAGGPGLVSRFPLWSLAPLPPFWECATGPLALGLLLMTTTYRPRRAAALTASVVAPKASGKRVSSRNEARTAALMAWVTTRTDNPLLTYELRTRTRSGRWFDWVVGAPLGLAAAAVLTLAYPAFIDAFSGFSPLHFFNGSSLAASRAAVLSLAALLLTVQGYALGFRGPGIGQDLIAKDRRQGTWGFLLLTPLTIKQIFWGKVFGQTAAVGTLWAGAGLGSLLLYLYSVPLVGAGPALAAWGSGQLLVAALFVLGVALGAALGTFPVVSKSLKGLSTLLFVLVVGGLVYAELAWLAPGLPDGWAGLALELVTGSIFALVLAALLFGFTLWRLTWLRGRDIAAGDGAG